MVPYHHLINSGYIITCDAGAYTLPTTNINTSLKSVLPIGDYHSHVFHPKYAGKGK